MRMCCVLGCNVDSQVEAASGVGIQTEPPSIPHRNTVGGERQFIFELLYEYVYELLLFRYLAIFNPHSYTSTDRGYTVMYRIMLNLK